MAFGSAITRKVTDLFAPEASNPFLDLMYVRFRRSKAALQLYLADLFPGLLPSCKNMDRICLFNRFIALFNLVHGCQAFGNLLRDFIIFGVCQERFHFLVFVSRSRRFS